MPTTIPARTVITHAVVGTRPQVISWFAANGLAPDAMFVAEQTLRVDDHIYIDRYVGHADTGLRPDEAAHYDQVIHLPAPDGRS